MPAEASVDGLPDGSTENVLEMHCVGVGFSKVVPISGEVRNIQIVRCEIGEQDASPLH